MKLFSKIMFSAVLAGGILASCGTDPVEDCKDTTVCLNGSTLVSTTTEDCSCDCVDGYMGADCGQEIRSVVVNKMYNVVDSCPSLGSLAFEARFSIPASATSLKAVKISPFSDPVVIEFVNATVVDATNITITDGNYDGLEILNGKGKIETSGTINFTYTLRDNQGSETCGAKFIPKN